MSDHPTPDVCPYCHQRAVVPIVFGFPGPELWEESERGDVLLGGCVIYPGRPERGCRACGWEEDRLDRFRESQLKRFTAAVLEVRAHKQTSGWMTYFFPQIAGIAELHGDTTPPEFAEYLIRDMDEAVAYLSDQELAERYLYFVDNVASYITAQSLEPRKALVDIFGEPDSRKFISSITLFYTAALEMPMGVELTTIHGILVTIEKLFNAGVPPCEDTFTVLATSE